jgi:hypothetical protein
VTVIGVELNELGAAGVGSMSVASTIDGRPNCPALVRAMTRKVYVVLLLSPENVNDVADADTKVDAVFHVLVDVQLDPPVVATQYCKR